MKYGSAVQHYYLYNGQTACISKLQDCEIHRNVLSLLKFSECRCKKSKYQFKSQSRILNLIDTIKKIEPHK